MLKFFLTISVALIEDTITVCESCHILGLEADVFPALYFKKVEGSSISLDFLCIF